MTMAKFHIKKGDTVKVISGNNKGKSGRVLEMLPEAGRAVVEGVNLIKRHTKPSATNPQGGIVEKEAPIAVSKLMLVDPKSGEPTRVGRKANEEGKMVRYAKKSGEILK